MRQRIGSAHAWTDLAGRCGWRRGRRRSGGGRFDLARRIRHHGARQDRRARTGRASCPPPDITNHWADDAAAAAFGQKLFFDPAFAGALLEGDNDGSSHTLGKVGETGRVACSGCHVPAPGFVDNRSLGEQVSLASGWLLRKTPTLLDVGQAKLITWGGRRDALYNQPFGPIESNKEMNSSRLFTAEDVLRRYKSTYESIFGPLSTARRCQPIPRAYRGDDRLQESGAGRAAELPRNAG